MNTKYYATFITDGYQHNYQYIVLGGANRLPHFKNSNDVAYFKYYLIIYTYIKNYLPI